MEECCENLLTNMSKVFSVPQIVSQESNILAIFIMTALSEKKNITSLKRRENYLNVLKTNGCQS